MSAQDFVAVNVSVTGGASPTRQGFGTPLIAAYHTVYADRVRFYSSSTALTQMVTDGFTTSSAPYKAMAAVVSQSPCPPLVGIGRRALKPSQTVTLTYTDTGVGDVAAFTLVGSDGVSHPISVVTTGTPGTDATAAAGIVNGITGHAATIGTTSAGGAILSISRVDGLLNDIKNWSPTIELADTTADPGIATDLAAIVAANNIGWYGLVLDSNSALEIEAAQGFIEATGVGGKYGFYNNSDWANTQSGTTSDVFSVLAAATRNKCALQQNDSQLLSYGGAALAGLMLSANPGSKAAAYKSQVGVPADTDVTLTETQALAINGMTAGAPGPSGKKGNYYKTTSGLNLLYPGCEPSGQWIDVTIGIDWLQVNLQADVLAVLAGFPKIPLTDAGLAIIGNTIMNRLKIAASPAYGLIDGTQPIIVDVPKAASLLPTDRAARNVPGITWQASIAGAIVTLTITGTLTQ